MGLEWWEAQKFTEDKELVEQNREGLKDFQQGVVEELFAPECSPKRAAEISVLIKSQEYSFPPPSSIIKNIKGYLMERYGLEVSDASDIVQEAYQRYTCSLGSRLHKN